MKVRDEIQSKWDILVNEADEIELILSDKFGLKGGGRLLINQVIHTHSFSYIFVCTGALSFIILTNKLTIILKPFV